MDRRTTVSFSALLYAKGEPFLEWIDASTSTLRGYQLDVALLALWERHVGRYIASHVKLAFHPGVVEVWADTGAGLRRWAPTSDADAAERIATACGLTAHTPEALRDAVTTTIGSTISVPELRFK